MFHQNPKRGERLLATTSKPPQHESERMGGREMLPEHEKMPQQHENEERPTRNRGFNENEQ